MQIFVKPVTSENNFLFFSYSATNQMTKHSSIPYISSTVVDFQSTDIVGRATVAALVKLHGEFYKKIEIVR